MADPVTWLAIAGTVFSTVGAIQQGRAEEKAFQYNATIQRQNAETEIAAAEARAERKRREMDKLISSQRAMAGASGLTVDSFQDVMAETIMTMEADALNLEYGGIAVAQGLEAGARLDESAGRNAKLTGLWSGAANALAGGTRIIQYNQGTADA